MVDEERYKGYNSEEDLNGAIGPSIANQMEMRYGSIENVPKLISRPEVNEEGKRKEKIIEIINSTPKIRLNSPNLNRKLNSVLGRIKGTGEEMKNYHKMSLPEKWNYYRFYVNEFLRSR